MKFLIAPIIVLFLTSCTAQTTPSASPTETATTSVTVTPERKADLYGKIVSLDGNEATILLVDTSKDPTFSMTSEEKKKYMQSLDEAARMALKQEINSATLGETKVTLPVGIPMTMKSAAWPTAPTVDASLADVRVGQYVSIWKNAAVADRAVAEFVKIAFTQ